MKHAFFAAQAVLPGMIAAGKGSIINFGSISWMILTGNLAAYTASKAAMHGSRARWPAMSASTASASTRWCRAGS
jgi:NAD(P)-dependent dehydrogenase (short-subunit alcohol dehydrogenase family)